MLSVIMLSVFTLNVVAPKIVLATVIHCHPGLVYAGKTKGIPLEWSPVGGSALLGSILYCKYD
jgi:hypothetical protein